MMRSHWLNAGPQVATTLGQNGSGVVVVAATAALVVVEWFIILEE